MMLCWHFECDVLSPPFPQQRGLANEMPEWVPYIGEELGILLLCRNRITP